MSERFAAGSRVRVNTVDPPHHTRAPHYVRGHVGTVVALHGRHRLPDDILTNASEPRVEAVYAVRFDARALWGTGDHTITVNLWESYLGDAEESA